MSCEDNLGQGNQSYALEPRLSLVDGTTEQEPIRRITYEDLVKLMPKSTLGTKRPLSEALRSDGADGLLGL